MYSVAPYLCACEHMELLSRRHNQHFAAACYRDSSKDRYTLRVAVLNTYMYVYMYVCMHMSLYACMYATSTFLPLATGTTV